MSTRAELKQRAKDSLRGKYGDFAKAALIYLAIFFVIGLVLGISQGIFGLSKETGDLVNSIITAVLSSVFIAGFYSYFLKISRNEEVDFHEIFAHTDRFVAVLGISILVTVFCGLWSLLLVIPGIIAAFSYSQVYFVMLDNPEMSITEVLARSKAIMKGHKMDYFMLSLSFIGWCILAAIPLCLGYFWLIPYMSVTMANFYNEIKDNV